VIILYKTIFEHCNEEFFMNFGLKKAIKKKHDTHVRGLKKNPLRYHSYYYYDVDDYDTVMMMMLF